MNNDTTNKKRNTLNDVICSQLVTNVAGSSVAIEWGSYEGSDGYEEAKGVFNKKYNLINFEEFKNEIILSWYREVLKSENEKKSMKEVLNLEESNEESRPLYNNTNESIRKVNKENALNGIDNKIKDNLDTINESINNIDTFFYKEIIENVSRIIKCKDKRNKEEIFDKNIEIEKLIKSLYYIDFIESIKNKKQDTDSFYEDYLKPINDKSTKFSINKNYYNEEITTLINAKYNAKLNTISKKTNTNSRRKTKKSIFDKIEEGNFQKTTLEEFIKGYDEIIELYDLKKSNKNLINLDELVKFYYIEDRYNVVFFLNLALELIEIKSSYKTELIDKFFNLAILDLNIYRSKIFKSNIVKDIIIEHEKRENIAYKKVLKEIEELIKLKSKIIDGMFQIKKINHENFEQFISEHMITVIHEISTQIIKVDIEKYLNNKSDSNKVLKCLKSLLENNKEILLKRNGLINSIKIEEIEEIEDIEDIYFF